MSNLSKLFARYIDLVHNHMGWDFEGFDTNSYFAPMRDTEAAITKAMVPTHWLNPDDGDIITDHIKRTTMIPRDEAKYSVGLVPITKEST